MPETAHPDIANANLSSPRGIPGLGSNYFELRRQEFFVLRIELPIVVFRIRRDNDWFPAELRQMTREEANACCRRKTARNKVGADDGYAFQRITNFSPERWLSRRAAITFLVPFPSSTSREPL